MKVPERTTFLQGSLGCLCFSAAWVLVALGAVLIRSLWR